eukprot:1139095-Pelagomonas_calceolata.AAC.2
MRLLVSCCVFLLPCPLASTWWVYRDHLKKKKEKTVSAKRPNAIRKGSLTSKLVLGDSTQITSFRTYSTQHVRGVFCRAQLLTAKKIGTEHRHKDSVTHSLCAVC